MSLWKISAIQNTNEIISGFLTWNFCSLGLPGSFLGFLITHQVPTKPKKLPGSLQEASRKLQKIRGRDPYNIFVAIWVEAMTPKRNSKINWPLVLAFPDTALQIKMKLFLRAIILNESKSFLFWMRYMKRKNLFLIIIKIWSSIWMPDLRL